MEFFQYMPLGKARDKITASLRQSVMPCETVELTDALGRIAGGDIIAQEDLPPFSRSTVDGFAVRSADSFGASEAAPAFFFMIGEVLMGEHTTVNLLPGQAVSIPTGGMLPSGADAVVMLEHTEQPDPHSLLLSRMIAPGENVVSRGEDISTGAVIIERGQELAPQHIGALAACGYRQVPVRRKVTVAIISTGDELVDVDEPVQFGQIRDINSYVLGARLTALGCEVRKLGIVKDRYDSFLTVLTEAVAACQMVVISGGSSVGARDYTVKAINALGEPGVLIHGIAVKPGRPSIFGMVDTVPVFGLPGHPVAAMIVCEQLVRPALYTLMGKKSVADFSIPARLARNVASAPGRDDFIAVKLARQDGVYTAQPVLGKSGLISIMTQADGVIHIEEGKSGVYTGEQVEVFLIHRG